MSTRRQICIAAIIVIFATAARLQADAPVDFVPGQPVEVREGDTWSAAVFEKREGHKFQIKYADGSLEEWVTAERIRLPGSATDASSSDKPADAKPASPTRAKFENGAQVEAKWGGLWRKAVVNNSRTGDWYLVNYQPGTSQEWVEWWRLRKQGDTADTLPYCAPNGFFNKGDNPPRPDAGDTPVDEKRHGRSHGADAGDKAATAFAYPVKNGDLIGVQSIALVPTDAWAVPLDPANSKLQLATSPIDLKSTLGIRNNTMLQAGSYAALIVRDEFGGVSKSITFEKINLASGTAQPVVSFDPQSVPLAISPNGKRVLAQSSGRGWGKSGRLDVWTSTPAGIEHLISFLPLPGGADHDVDIVRADFTDDDHAYTLLHSGDLILWDLTNAKAIWRVSLDSEARIALTPGRKNLLATHENTLYCFDAATGAVQGTIAGGRPLAGDVDVSPDGERLVAGTETVVSLYDLKAGKFLGDVGLPVGAKGSKTVALPSHFALVGSTLIDLDKKAAVWTYANTRYDFYAGDRCWNVVSADKHGVLVNAKLPHASAIQVDQKLPNSVAFLLKPGDRVALEVSVNAPADLQAKVTDTLKAEITRAGYAIDPAASVRIVGRTFDGKTMQEQYRAIGVPFAQAETVNVTDKITALSIESAGKPAWVSQTISRPGLLVDRRQGQSVDAAVQAADQYNVSFLLTARLPNYVLPPTGTVGFGQSQWTTAGVKDGQ